MVLQGFLPSKVVFLFFISPQSISDRNREARVIHGQPLVALCWAAHGVIASCLFCFFHMPACIGYCFITAFFSQPVLASTLVISEYSDCSTEACFFLCMDVLQDQIQAHAHVLFYLISVCFFCFYFFSYSTNGLHIKNFLNCT